MRKDGKRPVARVNQSNTVSDISQAVQSLPYYEYRHCFEISVDGYVDIGEKTPVATDSRTRYEEMRRFDNLTVSTEESRRKWLTLSH